MIEIVDGDRIRLIRLNRPETKNAFNEAMYDAVTEALLDADDDPKIAVVVLTGNGDSFSSGTDIIEMAARTSGAPFTSGKYGFPGLADELIRFSKPLLCAVNGIGLGIGVTILGLVDLAFMADDARVKCPFTSLALAPEAGSSITFPQLLGKQNAMWTLLSSEWLTAAECLEMGLIFKVCAGNELLETTMKHASILAGKPISSLVASKNVIMEPIRQSLLEARKREDAAFQELLGKPANIEAMVAFAEKRDPNFSSLGE
ncbi:MAG: enoyl-CoA hydratase/isomerase family protein [Acidimicrobiales bacterium]|nr:enoyl-CoA hydratase/isomerase family protein [Acidimicrobiales bacterium]MDG1846288.1 enoyl-CoA hydratase/isomerase family protein [Acidimicrobiales bacterium]